MRTARIFALMVALAAGMSWVEAHQDDVVFKLKPKGKCKEKNGDKPFEVPLCVAEGEGEWVSVCVYSSRSKPSSIEAQGFTVAVETLDQRVEFVEVKLGPDVPGGGEVDFFDASIQSNFDGQQWLIANVILATSPDQKTMTIPGGESSSKSILEFRIALGRGWADYDDNIPPDRPASWDEEDIFSEVYLTDDARLNGFPQKNLVTEKGLTLLADISTPQSKILIPIHGPRIDLLKCEFVDRNSPDDPFEVKLTWKVYGECAVQWQYTTKKCVQGCASDAGFKVFVDGEAWKFPDNRGGFTCQFIEFPPPIPACREDPPCPNEDPDIARCDPRPPREFTATVTLATAPFDEAELRRANGHHFFKVCANFRTACADCPCPPSPLPPSGTICSTECVGYVPVIQCECRTCGEDPRDPDACSSANAAAGPYWCLVNPRLRLGDKYGNLFVGDTTVRDFDMLDAAGKDAFKKNGPKMAFQFEEPFDSNYMCINLQTLVCIDWKGQEVLYLDPDWRPSNNAGGGPPADKCCPDPVLGVARNVPRDVNLWILVLKNGKIVNVSVNPSCKYTFGWKRGDANLDQVVNILDAVDLLNGVFMMNANVTNSPFYLSCARSANANGGEGRGADDELLNISDAVYLMRYVLLGGPAPLAPFHTDPFHPDGFGNVWGALKDCVDPYGKGSSQRVKCPLCAIGGACGIRD